MTARRLGRKRLLDLVGSGRAMAARGLAAALRSGNRFEIADRDLGESAARGLLGARSAHEQDQA